MNLEGLPKDAKEIPGFPGYYATPSGDIWSGPNQQFSCFRKLQPGKHPSGHLMVAFYQNKQHHTRLVHRVILETFIGPRSDNKECRHINGIPDDNHLENLCWDTRKNNIADRHIHTGRHSRAKLNVLQVRIIKKLLKFSTLTPVEIGDIFGVARRTISHIKCGDQWQWV